MMVDFWQSAAHNFFDKVLVFIHTHLGPLSLFYLFFPFYDGRELFFKPFQSDRVGIPVYYYYRGRDAVCLVSC